VTHSSITMTPHWWINESCFHLTLIHPYCMQNTSFTHSNFSKNQKHSHHNLFSLSRQTTITPHNSNFQIVTKLKLLSFLHNFTLKLRELLTCNLSKGNQTELTQFQYLTCHYTTTTPISPLSSQWENMQPKDQTIRVLFLLRKSSYKYPFTPSNLSIKPSSYS
jgi:hypothetical protein